MNLSKTALHPSVADSPDHRVAIANAISALVLKAQVVEPPLAISADHFEIPLTTVSLNSTFDAYLTISFDGAPASSVQLVVDSGNSTLIVPNWEDIHAIPDHEESYQILGQATEPWGCPANVVKGPINLSTTSGTVYTIRDCVFYACTGAPPSGGGRTANFGAGCLSPWTANGWNTPANFDVTMQSPLSYDATYPYVEFNFAPAPEIHGAFDKLKVSSNSFIKLMRTMPKGYSMFDIIPDCEWMSLIPKSLSIGGKKTGWPGAVDPPIAMVDTGGGPVFLSDPNGYVYATRWPNQAENPWWTATSTNCESVDDAITIEVGDQGSSFEYVIDTSAWPASVKGLTLVMCEHNEYMRGRQGMNIGGISALQNYILIDFARRQVGFMQK